jgi:hypothetical protein
MKANKTMNIDNYGKKPDCNHVSEGPGPLLIEVMGSNPLQAIPTVIELAPVDEYAGSYPISAQLSKQKRLLVHLPKNRMLDTLASIVEQAKGLEVRIILGSGWRDAHVCNFLRAKGIDCFYIAQQETEGQHLPKVLLASEYRFASDSFSIHQASLVIFLEPDGLLRCPDFDLQKVFFGANPYQNLPEGAHRLDARCLFDRDFPTRFDPESRVLALSCEPYSTPDKTKLAGFFPAAMTIAPDGTQIFDGNYRMVPYRHKYVPRLSTSPTRLEVLKGCIWHNQHRNKFIMQIADAIHNEGRRNQLLIKHPGLKQVFDELGFTNVVVLVANNLHKQSLFQNYKNLASGDVSTIKVLTIEELLAIGYSALEGTIVIRCDAGIGGFPIEELPFELTLLDIADRNVPIVNYCKLARQKAYRQEGWKEVTNE